ncbi:MAG TPA: maleylpyruvate isomerase N-terminal domain-containing protein [Candidatus Limnocylindria bacterium]|nr:maleylpyruvate isomerase N-terminal domain-containing protein [Candidatus Limnocylindria bacterium]
MDRVRKDRLLATIRADRARFDRALAVVPPSRLTDPILPGGWSVKDVLAHIAWGHREAIGVIEARAMVGSALWDVPEDERNDAVVRESRSREVDEVRAHYRAAFDRYLWVIGELEEDDLNEPDHVRGLGERIPGWRPWRVLYDPAHLDEHRRTIQATFGSPTELELKRDGHPRA